MRAIGLVQVHLELAVADDAPESVVRRELQVATAVLERLAQEARHRVVDAGVTVNRIQFAVAAMPPRE